MPVWDSTVGRGGTRPAQPERADHALSPHCLQPGDPSPARSGHWRPARPRPPPNWRDEVGRNGEDLETQLQGLSPSCGLPERGWGEARSKRLGARRGAPSLSRPLPAVEIRRWGQNGGVRAGTAPRSARLAQHRPRDSSGGGWGREDS